MVLWWTLAGIAIAVVLGSLAWHAVAWRMRRVQRDRLRLAKVLFRRRREWLEAEFLSLASATGKPRSVLWAGCEFENAVSFARDRHTGQIRALVGVTIGLTPGEGQSFGQFDAEPAQREATAVFHFDGQRWMTDGRAVFNLNPEETIRRYRHELELAE
ncbi:MAG: hypothetical protein MUF48_03080 [Pirellulaceae bacterium]|jgi:hypothetical protein|nr:hypothetical protein [Pirellulaceae bacterium]